MTRPPTESVADASAQGNLFVPPADGTAGPSCPVQPEHYIRVLRARRSQITRGRVDLDAELPVYHQARAMMEDARH